MAKRRRPTGLISEASTLISIHGIELTLAEWGRRSGLGAEVIIMRLNSGWSQEDAVLKPKRRYRKRPTPNVEREGSENESARASDEAAE